jgi:hypothetical protein
VAHHSLNAHQVNPGGGEQRTVGVSQVVEPKRSQTCGITSSLEAFPHRGAVECLAEEVAEHAVAGCREVLAPTQSVQCDRRLVGERDATNTPALGRGLDSQAHCSSDGERVAGEVHVRPAQREQLAQAQAGVCGDADEVGVLGVLGNLERILGSILAMASVGERPGERLNLLRRVEDEGPRLRFFSLVC